MPPPVPDPAPALLPRRVLRRLGLAGLACLLLPWAAGTLFKAGRSAGLHDDPVRAAQMIDFLVIGVTVFALLMLVTVTMGCLVVAVMKGPVHVGDPFPQDRADAA